MKVRWLLSAATAMAAFVGGATAICAEDGESYRISDVAFAAAQKDDAKGGKDGCDSCGADKSDACGCESSCKGSCGDICEPWRLFPSVGQTTITGWAAAGATVNADSPGSRYNGPVSFNDRDEVQVNQLYAVIEREAYSSCDTIGFGGRIDVLFGTDYIFTQAVGLETTRSGAPKWNNRSHYGLALPQAYAEFTYNDLGVKVGHFYTIIGHEVVTAPDNFFYSHAYTMQYGEPFTHTGVLATYDYSDSLQVVAGVHNGWDNFDAVTERAGFIGGAFWTNCDESVSLAATLTSGHEQGGVAANGYSDRTMYSLVGSFQVSDNLQYIIQHDNGWQDDFAANGGARVEWYGLNQYLIYTINECWAAGARFEWFRDDDGARVAGVRAGNPAATGGWEGSFYEVTAGLNWTPCSNIIVRPEVRWDWFNGVGNPYDGNTKQEQFTAALDAIILF